MVTNTPVLSNVTKKTYNSVTEIYNICINHEKTNNKNEANLEGLNVLLKYEILTTDAAESLVQSGKLDINGANTLINEYKQYEERN